MAKRRARASSSEVAQYSLFGEEEQPLSSRSASRVPRPSCSGSHVWISATQHSLFTHADFEVVYCSVCGVWQKV